MSIIPGTQQLFLTLIKLSSLVPEMPELKMALT
jgi:hypothetical protein